MCWKLLIEQIQQWAESCQRLCCWYFVSKQNKGAQLKPGLGLIISIDINFPKLLPNKASILKSVIYFISKSLVGKNIPTK